MNNIHITPKKDTLEVKCEAGLISMKGNSILPDPRKFFKEINIWVEEYIKSDPPLTEVNLRFEYIDTASVQAVFDILKTLKGIPGYESNLVVNWYFEFDDPELLELGEIIQGRLQIKFNYIEYRLTGDN